MAKAPANLDEFDTSETLDLSALTPSKKETISAEPDEVSEVISPPQKSVTEVAKATVRKQKALRTEKPKYVTGTINAELDRRLKLLNIDTGISRQQALNEALDDYCRKKGYKPETEK